MPVVSENIVKEYKRRGNSFAALDNVSVTVKEGRIIAIVGASGSGKSTLLNVLSGMIKPEKGSVSIDGSEVFKQGLKKRDRLRAEKIGIVPQTQSLIPGLTAYENILLQNCFYPKERTGNEENLTELISALGLEELMDVYPKNLSGGEMKRVSIVRALSGDHKYIFADEPTGELDTENTLKVMEIFREKARCGKGILIVTHDKLVADLADSVYEMKNGSLRNTYVRGTQ